MWIRRHTGRRFRSTRVAAAAAWIVLGLAGFSPSAAQARPGPLVAGIQPAVESSLAAGAAMDPETAMAAFSVVESWIRTWRRPDAADLPPGVASGVRGASVTLRFMGEVVGRGT
ncbi:MAG TPA: hypothetical protein PKU91_10610, partial [Phycisphaerales bacterium]|nr:hypothetical protein [Phycisphaerales bacterium]